MEVRRHHRLIGELQVFNVTEHNVRAIATDNGVLNRQATIAVVDDDVVCEIAAEDRYVLPIATDENVAARATGQNVIAVFTKDRVVGSVSKQFVIARTATQHIISLDGDVGDGLGQRNHLIVSEESQVLDRRNDVDAVATFNQVGDRKGSVSIVADQVFGNQTADANFIDSRTTIDYIVARRDGEDIVATTAGQRIVTKSSVNDQILILPAAVNHIITNAVGTVEYFDAGGSQVDIDRARVTSNSHGVPTFAQIDGDVFGTEVVNDIVASTANEDVCTFTADKRVVSIAAFKPVITVLTGQHVIELTSN